MYTDTEVLSQSWRKKKEDLYAIVMYAWKRLCKFKVKHTSPSFIDTGSHCPAKGSLLVEVRETREATFILF